MSHSLLLGIMDRHSPDRSCTASCPPPGVDPGCTPTEGWAGAVCVDGFGAMTTAAVCFSGNLLSRVRTLASLTPSWIPPGSASCLDRESHVPRPVSCAPRGGQATSSAPYLLHSATGAKPQGHIDDFDIVKAEKAEQAAAKPEKPVHAIDPLIPIRLPGYGRRSQATSGAGGKSQSAAAPGRLPPA